MTKADELFEALEAAFRRGANWVAINGSAEGLNKAAHDFADYETSPLTIAERKALSASPAGGVKPLEWVDGRNDQTVFDVVQVAVILGADELIGLNYTVLGPDRHGLYEVVFGCKIIKTCDSEEAAKSAAFADYSARIMSAIEPAGVGVETPPPSSHVAGPFSDVLGFGASYQREGDQWVIYTMPGAKRIGSIDGYDKARLDWALEALRAAHAQGSVFSPWVPPTGTKRAIVEELRKARSDFMVTDFEIADRMVEAIRRLAAQEAEDNTPSPQSREAVSLTKEAEQ